MARMQIEKIAWIDSILRIDSSFFLFISGALISVAVNLYTGIFSDDNVPARWKYILTATCLTAIASILWAVFAWQLERIQRLFSDDKMANTWEMLVGHRRVALMTLLIFAIILTLGGLIIVPFGVQFPKAESHKNSRPWYDGKTNASVKATNGVAVP